MPELTIEVINNKLCIKFPYRPDILEAIKTVPSRKWDKDVRGHYIGKYDLPGVIDIFQSFNYEIKYTPAASFIMKYFIEWRHRMIALKKGEITGSYTVELKKPLRPFQKIGHDYLVYAQSGIVADDMGLGKAQPMTSKILTPDGWKLMGNIKAGDKAIGSDGYSCNTIGVFPQGMKNIYKITFSDDSFTECCDEHLWAVSTPNRRHRKSSFLILKTKEIISKTLFGGRVGYGYSIPLVNPVSFEKKYLPLHPYLLGVLIGDGGLSNESLIRFTTSDSFIVDKIRKLLPRDICMTQRAKYDYSIARFQNFGYKKGFANMVLNKLQSLKMVGCKSNTKFIPEIYKYSDIEDRIRLLQGLIDTDGYIAPEGHIDYYTVSEKLAKDIIFIVQSLGGTARIRTKKTHFTHNGIKKQGQLCYRVSIMLPKNILPCSLPKKLERYINRKRKYFPLRNIKKIEYIGKKEAQCIMVDSLDHLYVTDGFILTHNTVQVLSTYKTLKEQGKAHRMLVLCPSTVKGAWIKDIGKFTDLTYSNIDGDYKERKEQYLVNSDIIIMSYDSYLMDFGISERRKKAEEKKTREPIPLPLGIDVCAFDECQRLVRLKNKTTQSLLILKEKLHLNYIYPMTGTPIVNRVEDLWSLMVFIDPEVLGEFWQFRSRYCEIEVEEIKMLDPKLRKQGKFVKITRKIPKVVGYKNLDELKAKIDPYYIRREKKEVLKDLPDKLPETFELELTPDQRDMYNELKDQFFNEFKDVDVNMANALVWFIRAKQICDTAEILHPGMKDSAKMNELKDILTDLIENDNHKVVIFSQYKEMTDILVRDFSKYNPLYLHGDVKTADRQFLIDAFQEDPQYKLFVSTLRAGGVGITLTAADIVILYDKWFSPAANNQAIDRVHRIGQENPVTVIDFICKDTIEERIETILERKKTMFAGIFGEDEALLGKLSSEELRSLL